MKLKITFAQDNKFNHTINGVANIPSTKSSDTFYLTYNLTKNCSTTDKFIDLCKQTFQSESVICDYDFYKAKNNETYFSMKKRMNSVIEEVNTMDELPDIDTSLMLNISSGDAENLKTNELHLYFELTSKDILHPSDEAHNLLEEINQLVHSIEGGLDMYMKNIQPFCGTLRLRTDESSVNKLPLTDEDYDNFTVYKEWGDLCLDYFRVGKDLVEAAGTNDLNLITTKGLCQQSTVHTCMQLIFHSVSFRKLEVENIVKIVREIVYNTNQRIAENSSTHLNHNSYLGFIGSTRGTWNEEDCLEFKFKTTEHAENIRNQFIKEYNYTKVIIDKNIMKVVINDAVKKRTKDSEIEEINKWCDDNNVRDYYDIDLPMYNFGRVLLGKLDSIGFTKTEIETELSKCTTITNVELTDE